MSNQTVVAEAADFLGELKSVRLFPFPPFVRFSFGCSPASAGAVAAAAERHL